MPARLRFFRAKCRTETIDLSECRGGRLKIKLTGLREVRLLAEVVGLEQRRRPLGRIRGEDGRIDEHEIAVVEKIADAFLDFIANAQNGVLLR